MLQCILSDQPEPNSEEQSNQPYTWGQSHPRSLLENFFINDWPSGTEQPRICGRNQSLQYATAL